MFYNNIYNMDLKELFDKVAKNEITAEEAAIIAKNIQEKNTYTYSLAKCGGVSFYIRKKFPVTLYLSEIRILEEIFTSDDFKSFIELNNEKLKQ